jgi:multiple sugar transport system substrate-binding protein
MFQGMPSGFQAVTQALDTAKLGDFYTKNVQQIWNEVFTPNLDKLYNNDQSPEDTAKSIDDAGNALLVQ